VIANFQFEIASARMHSPTNFVVSSETRTMSTRGSVDAVQQSTFGGSIRFIEFRFIESRRHGR
jgi:hypothetical protein